MNCIWLLLLLCCCGNGNGNSCEGNSCGCKENACDKVCDHNHVHKHDDCRRDTCEDNSCERNNCERGCSNREESCVHEHIVPPPKMNYAGYCREDNYDNCYEKSCDRRDDYYDRHDCKCETCGCEAE